MEYLTDSSTFRFLVGKLDSEHENYLYTCVGDSVVVDKYTTLHDTTGLMALDTSSQKRLIERRALSISDLRKRGKFE
jgi:hypothetical protein